MGKEELTFHPAVIELLGNAAELPPGEGLSELLKNWNEEPVHLIGMSFDLLKVYHGDPMARSVIEQFNRIYEPVKVQVGAGLGLENQVQLETDGKSVMGPEGIDSYDILARLNEAKDVDIGIQVSGKPTASAYVRSSRKCELNCSRDFSHIAEGIKSAGETLGYDVTWTSDPIYASVEG